MKYWYVICTAFVYGYEWHLNIYLGVAITCNTFRLQMHFFHLVEDKTGKKNSFSFDIYEGNQDLFSPKLSIFVQIIHDHTNLLIFYYMIMTIISHTIFFMVIYGYFTGCQVGGKFVYICTVSFVCFGMIFRWCLSLGVNFNVDPTFFMWITLYKFISL